MQRRRETSGSGGRRLPAGVGYCILVFVIVRCLVTLVSFAGAEFGHARIVYSLPGWPQHAVTEGPHNLVSALERQDALWYLAIANKGYSPDDGSAAFFPLFPIAVRGLSWAIGGHLLAAGIVVSNGSFLGALLILYSLTRRELSEEAARRTVLYISVFPTSFFFFAPYSESTFLLLAVSAFWAVRRRAWPLAGVSGALASATRGIGAFLAPALAMEAVHQWFEDRRARALVQRLAWSAVATLGLLSYLAYWSTRGGALAPLRFQSNWQRVPMFPVRTLVLATKIALAPGGLYSLLDWLIVIPVILAAAYGLVRFRPAYSVYVWAGILAPLSLVFEQRPLMSVPRFVLPLFPIFWSFAALTGKSRLGLVILVAVFLGGFVPLTVMFVNAQFIF